MTDLTADTNARLPLIKPDSLAARLTLTPTSAVLEKRLQGINADMAALTPSGFSMPQNSHGLDDQPSNLQARLKNNELVTPDTEVLRQLLLEKARIARQLDAMPQQSRGLQMPKTGFSVQAKKRMLR